MRYAMMIVLVAGLCLGAQKSGPAPGPGTVGNHAGGGATASLVQHPTNGSCPNLTTCSIPLTTSITAGNLGVFAYYYGANASQTLSTTNNSGTFVHCSNCNTGHNAAAGGQDFGWTISLGAQSSSIQYTFSINDTFATAEFREYKCTGGTWSFDTSGSNGTASGATSPFAGQALTLGGTNEIVVQQAGTDRSITAISTYGNLDTPSGVGIADLLNTVSGTAPNWTSAGMSAETHAAVAFKCQ